MATEYIDLGIVVDPATLQDEATASLQSDIPGWEPAAGNLETILIELFSEMAAESASVASLMPTTVFRYFGANVVGLPPIDAVAATGTATFTSSDTLGHTIPAGTLITVGNIVFETTSDGIITAGSSSVNVPITAVVAGEDANGLSGAADLTDTLTYISSVALVGSTAGGIDAEDDDAYLSRLTAEFQTLAPRPIVPADFEVLARSIAGVDRAVAIDGFNPADSTYNNARMIALAAIDSAGEDVPAGTKTDIDTLIQSRREVNFVFNVISPTYTTIFVTTDITVLPGWDADSVKAGVASVLQQYLDPSNWGRFTDTGLWVNTTKVAYLNVANIVKGAKGVAFINSLKIGTSTAPTGSVDITLSGAAPLTKPATTGTAITVTNS